MSEQHGKPYRPWDPERSRHEAQSPAAKRPEGDWVFFLLDTVSQLDLQRVYAPSEEDTRGAPPVAPAMRGCLWLYAYCVGVFSSRKLALACERHRAFMAIVGQERPDFRTISACRQPPLEALKEVCVQVVRVASEAGLVHVGNVSTDGTHIQGHASRHKAMSYGSMRKAGERLREESEAVVTAAYQQDAGEDAVLGSRRGDGLPAELARRADRLVTIEAARRRLAARAKAEADAERPRRAAAEAERQRTGQKRRGTGPKPVGDAPTDKAPSPCTDPELPRRPTNHKGWDDCGNAQVSVDEACQIIGACDVTDASNDTQQAEPMAQAGLEPPKAASGAAHALPATWDTGSDRETAAQALEDCGFDPSMATGRQRHHGAEAEARAPPATAKERMAAKGRTPAGKALYARRKGIVAPVCGQSTEARGFRRFLRRGLAKIRGAWRLVCLTPTLLKMWR